MSEKLEIGTIVEGKVLRVKPFGAIVAINENTQGLVHISQISNSFVQDINEHIAVGDTVNVKVLSVDEETGKISLSIKETLPPPAKPSKPQHNFRNREYKNNYENKGSNNPSNEYFQPQPSVTSSSDFEDKMKEWLKQANEKQAGLNKRANRR